MSTLTLEEQAAPSTPGANKVVVYALPEGLLYAKDDAGTQRIVTVSSMTSSLSADVNLSTASQYFDGPSIAVGTSGTWFVSGTVTLRDATGTGVEYIGKLWDSSTVIASCYVQAAPGTNQWLVAALSGTISSPIANVRISVRANATTAKILSNASSNAKDSTITGIRIA